MRNNVVLYIMLPFMLAIASVSLAFAADKGISMNVADDLIVHGVEGSKTDADLKVKGYSVFGTTSAAYPAVVTSGQGGVFMNNLEIGTNAYLWGKLGVGTATPFYMIDVAGGGHFTSSMTVDGFYYGDGSRLTGVITSTAVITARIDEVAASTGAIAGDLAAEAAARGDADLAIGVATGALRGDLTAETTNRGNADNALSGRLDVVAVDTGTIAGNLANEVIARGDADLAIGVTTGALRGDLTAEAAARGDADLAIGVATGALRGDLTAETTNRGNADNALSGRLDVVAVDTGTIAGNLANEVIARGDADLAIGVTTGALRGDLTALAVSTGAIDASVVHLAGAENITGAKTFTAAADFTLQSPTVPGVTVSSGMVVAAGNVGLGVAAPASKLEIKDTLTSGQKLAVFYEGNDMVFWIEKK